MREGWRDGFASDANCRFRRRTGGTSRKLQAADGVKASVSLCAILCGIAPSFPTQKWRKDVVMESQGIFQIHPKPRQEPEVPARCSIVALRPVGRIARFAPHLQVAVSATGRAPFRCLPVLTQIHAAPPARPRSARTLRVPLCSRGPLALRDVRGTPSP